MKKTVIILLTGIALSACADKKAQEKAILDSVMQVHDKVMGADEQLMKNKMQLDTLLKQSNLPAKDTAALLSKKLTDAENNMDTWMHNFNPDNTGKTHTEVMAYLTGQKKQIMVIDSQLNEAVSKSNKYLLKIKAK